MNLPAISAEIKRRIDAHSASETEDPSWHLGASEIGDECLRRSWYKFRWIKRETFSGAQRRLFKRGHREEPQLAELLTAIGFDVRSHDSETGKQFRGSSFFGHFAGSSDGKALFPPDFNINETVQLEYKTHNLKSFKGLEKDGLIKSKPKHYIQMCVYGKFNEISYGLYMATCKDNDEIYIEFLPLDADVAEKAQVTAERIISATEPPPKIGKSAAFFKCKFCHLSGVCHEGEHIDRNCRSCKNARPIGEGFAEWYCDKWNAKIPREHALAGCGEWTGIV